MIGALKRVLESVTAKEYRKVRRSHGRFDLVETATRYEIVEVLQDGTAKVHCVAKTPLAIIDKWEFMESQGRLG
tara:strand:- start:91 stop:312 length:222 start_codon:yes stop_codon:yes gene_type:complete